MKLTTNLLIVSMILLVVIGIASLQNTLGSLYVALVVLPLMFVANFFYNRAQRRENERLIAQMRASIKNLSHSINIQ